MSNNQQIVMNRIKVTLVEKQKTNRWLAEQMGKSMGMKTKRTTI